MRDLKRLRLFRLNGMVRKPLRSVLFRVDMASGPGAGLIGLRIVESFHCRPVRKAGRCRRWRG